MKPNSFFDRLRRVAGHSGVRRYGGSMVWLAAEKTVRLIAGVLVAAFVARRLGTGVYGELNYAISLPAMFAALSGMGLDVLVVRELVRRPELRDELLGTSFVLKLAGFALLLAATMVAVAVLGAPPGTRLPVMIIACGYVFNAFQVIDFHFQARVLGKYSAISQTAAVTAASALRILLAVFNAELVWFAVAELFYMAAAAAMYLVCSRVCGGGVLAWKWSGSVARGLMRDGWPLLAAGVASGFYSRFDQVAVTRVLGASANGCYAVAVRLLELCYIPAIIAADTLFPAIAGRGEGTVSSEYRRRVRLLIGAMFYASLAALPFLLAGGYWGILLLYGAEYRLSAALFCFFALKIPIFAATYALSKWYVAENMQAIALCTGIMAALVFAVSAEWLVAVFGVWGAAGGSILLTALAYTLFALGWRKGREGALLLWRGVCAFPTAGRIETVLGQHREL